MCPTASAKLNVHVSTTIHMCLHLLHAQTFLQIGTTGKPKAFSHAYSKECCITLCLSTQFQHRQQEQWHGKVLGSIFMQLWVILFAHANKILWVILFAHANKIYSHVRIKNVFAFAQGTQNLLGNVIQTHFLFARANKKCSHDWT